MFGWGARENPGYTEFQHGGRSVAGLMEMPAEMPKEIPSYWMPYVAVDVIEASFKRAVGLGASQRVPPQEFPGGRFAVFSDPQGAALGLLRVN